MVNAPAHVQVQAPEEQSAPKLLNLKDISQLGYLQKTKKILKDVTVTLQTLPLSRQQKVLSLIPADTTDPIVKFTHLQVETLAHATLAINGETFNEAHVDNLRSFYAGLQSRVLQEFYAVYQELMDEQEKVLDSLKKT